MGYAIVEEVEVGFHTLTQEERERTAALLGGSCPGDRYLRQGC